VSIQSTTSRLGRIKHVIELPVDRQVKWEDTRSPLVIAWNIVLISAILLLTISASLAFGTLIPFGIGLIVSLFPAWKIVKWRWEWRIITEGRYIVVNGMRADNIHIVPLRDIKSMDYKRPQIASAFGLNFWNFEITSVDDRVTTIPAVRDKEAVAQLLSAMVGVHTGP